jgi:hypothetical protein
MKNITISPTPKLQHIFSRDRPSGWEYTTRMTPKLKQIIKEVKKLSGEEREILTSVISSIELAEVSEPVEEIEAAWNEEMMRRLKEIDEGKVKMLSEAEWDATIAKNRAKYNRI